MKRQSSISKKPKSLEPRNATRGVKSEIKSSSSLSLLPPAFCRSTLEGEKRQICAIEIKKMKKKAGVKICPKISETVYQPFWGILKLSGMVNQIILNRDSYIGRAFI